MRCSFTPAFYSIGALALVSFASSSQAVITFGTDANGNAISGWSELGVPGQPNAANATVTTDGSGLHINFTSEGGSREIQIGDTATFFGANTSGDHYIEVGWLDNNTGGATAQPKIDFIASDGRAGKLNNYVTGGSLFAADRVATMRYTAPVNVPKENNTVFDTARPASGQSISHTMRFVKLADGTVNTVYDNVLVTSSSWFVGTTAGYAGVGGNTDLGPGLGTDHSAWTNLELRVRGGDAGESFTFTSLTMGDVPEPASLSLLGVAAIALCGRRRRSA